MSSSSEVYSQQSRPLEEYYKHMDASMATKVWPSLVHIFSQAGWKIVDMGTGSGDAASQYAKMFTWSDIIGVDINPDSVEYCSIQYSGQNNLSFEAWNIENMLFIPGSLDAILNSSTLHHVSSFNNYSKENIRRSIENQITQLKDGGILFIRDFLIPSWNKDIILELSTQPRTCSCDNQNNSCISKFCQMSDADLFVEFCKTSRSLHNVPGYPMVEINWEISWYKKFKLSERHATEFVLRKDYRQSWDVELQEEYTYFTQEEFEQSFRDNGMRIIASYPYHNPWIIENRFKDKFFIYDDNDNPIDYPATNYIIIGQKISESSEYGNTIIERTKKIIEDWEDSFLLRKSYKNNETWEIWDIVNRPGEVQDIIPYSINPNTGEISINMRFWAPRPILWLNYPSLDKKTYDGYACEPHSISPQSTQSTLKERTEISKSPQKTIEWLKYYTSPWILWEQVSSQYMEYTDLPDQHILPNISDFNYSWEARTLKLNDILRACQTGTMPEARVELNLYNLLKTLWKQADEWIGDNISIQSLKIPENQILKPEHIISPQPDNRFTFSQETWDYLQHLQSRFEELLQVWDMTKSLWESTLEHIRPKNMSTNVLSALPVIQNKIDWEIYVGIEEQYYPWVQEDLQSWIWTVPAYRLPNEVESITDLQRFSTDKIWDTPLQKIWESYKSSMWVTTETIYPYITSWNHINSGIKYVKLDILIANINSIHDAHLLISLFRLQHILDSDKASFS